MSQKEDKAKPKLKSNLGKRNRDEGVSEEEMDQDPKKTQSSSRKQKNPSGEVS